MSKVIVRGEACRKSLKKGLDEVVDTVKVTIGPKGRNIAMEGGFDPLIANDAGTIAKDIILKDKVENIGASVAKMVIRKTSEKVGGGRTASAILTQAIFNEGLSLVEKGANVNEIKKGMEKASKDITEGLRKLATPVKTKEELKQVATISTESEEFGEIIANVVHKVGKNGIVTIEESDELSYEVTEGLKFDKGWISPYLVSNQDRMEAEIANVPILLVDKKVSMFKELMPVLKRITSTGVKDLVLIAEDIDGDALPHIIMNKIQGMLNILAIKTPGFGDQKRDWLEDISTSVGATVVSDQNGISYETVTLGHARKVISTKDHTVIIGGDTKEQVKKLTKQKELTDNKFEKDKLEKRIAVLSNGIAVIKVGAATESEMKYKKLKLEDGVNEAKRALEEGVVVGGDCAFLIARGEKHEGTDDLTKGYNAVWSAVEAPLRQIATNAGDSADIVVKEVSNGKFYDASDNSLYTEKRGILDAVKVPCTALENAVSGASMLLTTEGAVVEVEDKSNN